MHLVPGQRPVPFSNNHLQSDIGSFMSSSPNMKSLVILGGFCLACGINIYSPKSLYDGIPHNHSGSTVTTDKMGVNRWNGISSTLSNVLLI